MAKKQSKKVAQSRKVKARKKDATKPRCGLCGATTDLTKTECCGNWICDDEGSYVLFSYAHNSCNRNHRRYTLCGSHFGARHPGEWKTCKECREDYPEEIYVYYGTNEYNFDVLEDPPEYEPTKCDKCGSVIVLAEGGYSYGPDGYKCGSCMAKEHPDLFKHFL